MGFIKSDIPRYPHSTSNRIIAAITFVLRAVSKEDTLNGLRSQFSAVMRWKENKTGTPKASEVRSMTKKSLVGSTPCGTEEGRQPQPISEVEAWKKGVENEKSQDCGDAYARQHHFEHEHREENWARVP